MHFAVLLLAVVTKKPIQVAPIGAASLRVRNQLNLNLAPSAKLKLQQTGRSLAHAAVVTNPAEDVKRGITNAFPGAHLSDSQMNALSIYALTEAVAAMKSDLDSMSELGETESLRLQMAMDRMSKLMATLSNLEKKVSDTSEAVTQNLK